ncbi:MAG: NAD-binding protein [Saprospiraceae bacterium]
MSEITAKTLEQEYNVTVIAKDKLCCKRFAENLHSALVINGNYSSVDILLEEGLENVDALLP